MTTKRITNILFRIIFHAGALIGLLLTALAAWADLEAAVYGFDMTGGQRLTTLDCPMLMTVDETNSFSVKVTNTTDGKLSPYIKTDVTTRLMPVSSYTPLLLAPGESKRVEWTIGPENLELRQFIFAHARVYGYYPLPNRENTCGIFVVNLPTNGKFIIWTMVGLSLLGMGVGLYGVTKSQGSMRSEWADLLRFRVLAVLVIAGIFTGFMGWWVQGVIVIVVSLLLILFSIFVVRQ